MQACLRHRLLARHCCTTLLRGAPAPTRPRSMTSTGSSSNPAWLNTVETPGQAPEQVFFRDTVYKAAKEKGSKVPWDTGAPQPALVAAPELFHGRVLDVGCGLGQNGLWVASLPAVTSVTSVDFAEGAIAGAKSVQEEALAAGSTTAGKVSFLQADVYALPFPPPSAPDFTAFDVLLDSAVFHCIGDDDAQERYVRAVTPHVRPGGRAVMLAFSDANPEPWTGPRRISREHATRIWGAAGWRIDSIEDTKFQTLNTTHAGLAILMQATRVA